MVLVSINYAYAVDFSGALRIIDISDPHSLTLIGSFETSVFNRRWLPYSLDIQGDYAYLGCSKGLMAIDISDPTLPQLAGVYDQFYDHVNSVVVRDSIAYCTYAHQTGSDGSGMSGMTILNISDPTYPFKLISFITGRGLFNRVLISDNIIFASGWINDGIYFYSLEDLLYPLRNIEFQRNPKSVMPLPNSNKCYIATTMDGDIFTFKIHGL